MKEEWLMPGAIVPVDVETTQSLIAEIKRLIDVVGGMALNQQQEREESQGKIETLYAMYEVVTKQRDYLMDQQSAQVAAMRGRVQ